MITIASSILFSSFYALYNTSKRVPLSYNSGLEKWMKNNPNSTKTIGLTLLVVAYILWVLATSFGVGTLLFVIELMVIGSFIVILKPLKIVNFEMLIILFSTILILEIYYS
ncbi:hypothetical protein [Flavobacterium columnare]|jgi:hypothetical protein|uniref:hypothetical protein n=1 Tax=Flavobacterium columnare TaxID=996 RepID=UPI0040342746